MHSNFGCRVTAAAYLCLAGIFPAAVLGEELQYFGGPPEEPEAGIQSFAVEPEVETSLSDLKVLMAHSLVVSDRDAVEAALAATGLFGLADIDTWHMNTPSPTAADLSVYDCVYVAIGENLAAPAAEGDLLADYVDLGGGVILAVPAISRTDLPFELQGRIMSATYNPLVPNTTPLNGTTGVLSQRSLGVADASHPILDGVAGFTYFANNGFSEVTVDPGATLVASDNVGSPLIGLSSAGDVAAFNVAVRPAFGASPGVFRALANACEVVAMILIDINIDLKPGSDTNPINLSSNGVIPVALFGSEIFDVREVNVSTLRLADAGVKMVGKKNKELCSFEDVDADGWEDLVCKFDTVDLGLSDSTTTEIEVKGELLSGRKFRGSDVVTIVKE